MMKIAVVDVAAEKSGAKSIFEDFLNFIIDHSLNSEIHWDFYTSVLDIKEQPNLKLLKNPSIKKSWLHRILWEKFTFSYKCKNEKYDLVISLQNKALPTKIPQIVYFHNVLLIQDKIKFSFFKKSERILFIYNRIIGPVSTYSLKKVLAVFVQNETTCNILSQKRLNSPIYIIKPNIYTKDKGTFFREKKIKGFIYPATALSYKNHELIIEASNKIDCHEELEILFTITGDENEYAKFIRKKCENNPHIKFVGELKRDNLLEMFSKYGLINVSKLESFGFSLYEAMAFNTPIISVNYEYAVEAVNNYPYTILCDENAEHLAKSMENAMELLCNETYSILNEYENQWMNMITWIKDNIKS